MEYRGKPTPSKLPPARLAQIGAHVVNQSQKTQPLRSQNEKGSAVPIHLSWTPRRRYMDLGGGERGAATVSSHHNTPCDVLLEPAAGKKEDGERSYLDAPRDALPQDPSLRSSRWFLADELNTMRHVSRTKQMGYDDKDFQGKPIIAIINTWSDLLPCHSHFKERVEEVKRGVWQAGGFPAELPALAVSETFMKPSSMLYRNLLAMQVEEMLRSHPCDGAVLMGGYALA